MKNPNDPIGNQIRDPPICNAVPQPTAPRRATTNRNKFYGTLENDPNWLHVNTMANEICCVVTFDRTGNNVMNT
jgi:hypothetical protein